MLKWTSQSASSLVIQCAAVLLVMSFDTCLGDTNEHHAMDQPLPFYWAEVKATYIDPITNTLVHEVYDGKYGDKSLVEPRTGLALHVRNKDNRTHGCDEYHGIQIPTEPWIALVERGHCYFTDKIRIATKIYNASAVVIYNNADDDIVVMQHTVPDETSVLVQRETGQKLAQLTDRNVRVMVTVLPGKKDLGKKDLGKKDLGKKDLYKSTIKTHSFVPVVVIAAAVVVVVVVIISIVAWLVCMRRICRGWKERRVASPDKGLLPLVEDTSTQPEIKC